MSLNSSRLSGIYAPIGSYLCNSNDEHGCSCADINVLEWGKTIHMNDEIELTGTELWEYCSERKAFCFHCKHKVINPDENISLDRMICSRFIWRDNNRELGMGDFSGGLGDLVYFHDDRFNGSVDLFKAWLKGEVEKGHPVQLVFSLEKPFICSIDFSNHVKYYGFENTFASYSFMGQKKTIRIG